MTNSISHLQKQVASGSHRIFERGLVQAGEGNVSARVQDKDELLITPTFNDYASLTEDDVVHLGFSGKKLSQGRDPSSEYRLHIAVYQARPRVGAVIHTHSPYATMLSVAGTDIPVLLEEMLLFTGGTVPVSDYGLANTDALAENAVAALCGGNGILMANHGCLAVGRSMEQAVKVAELVEKMARVYWGAQQVGEVHTVPEAGWELFLDKFEEKFSTY